MYWFILLVNSIVFYYTVYLLYYIAEAKEWEVTAEGLIFTFIFNL